MKPVKSFLCAGLALTIIGLLTLACTRRGSNGETTTSAQPKRITVATAKNLWCTLTLVAVAKDYFRREGLDTDVQYLQGGRYCLDAVLSGSANFGNVVEVNIAYLGFTGNHTVSVIGNIATSEAGSAIVARRSCGVSKPQDLRGKRLAFSPGTTSDVFAHWYLRKYGLTPKDVTLLNVQPMAMQSTILGKGVDAVSIWQPFIYNITNVLGSDAVVLADASVYKGYEHIAVQRNWAAKNEAQVRAYLRAMRAADQFVKEHQGDAQAIVAKSVDLDLGTVKAIWADHQIGLSLDEREIVGAVTSIGRWIHETESGYADKPVPDYSGYFDETYVKAQPDGPRQ